MCYALAMTPTLSVRYGTPIAGIKARYQINLTIKPLVNVRMQSGSVGSSVRCQTALLKSQLCHKEFEQRLDN